MLSAQERAAFERDGYVIQRQLLDAQDLESVRQVIAHSVERRIQVLREQGAIGQTYGGEPFERRWARVFAEYSQSPHPAPHLTVWGRHDILDRVIYDLYTDPRLTSAATALIGPAITANGDFWVRPKAPGDQTTTLTWHQDSFYYGGVAAEHLQVLSVWIPLVDVDVRNGCLKLVPGSHRFGRIPARANQHNHQEPVEAVATYGQVVDEPMRMGDVLFFHNHTLHASGENSTDQVRWSIDLRYSPDGQGFDWHKMGEEFNVHFPCFVAASPDPAQVESWEAWQARWQANLPSN
ncbi:MAG: phytanoyl-CoA dioxygenase family protein [Candidatus Handelsmanbacteria bacterium]|nr:phytanoyl-CoA dioxygenase family protein [Candidatus Handelsmanbacteria bacterium]